MASALSHTVYIYCNTVSGSGSDPRPTGPYQRILPVSGSTYQLPHSFTFASVLQIEPRERETESKECFGLHTHRGFPKLLTTLTSCINQNKQTLKWETDCTCLLQTFLNHTCPFYIVPEHGSLFAQPTWTSRDTPWQMLRKRTPCILSPLW